MTLGRRYTGNTLKCHEYKHVEHCRQDIVKIYHTRIWILCQFEAIVSCSTLPSTFTTQAEWLYISRVHWHCCSRKQTARKSTGGKAPPQAAGHQGGSQIRTRHRRCKETASLPPRNRCSSRNPKVPEIHRSVDPETSISKIGS